MGLYLKLLNGIGERRCFLLENRERSGEGKNKSDKKERSCQIAPSDEREYKGRSNRRLAGETAWIA